MDAFAAPAENIVPRSLSKEHGPLLVLVCLPFLIGIVFWVRERRILAKLAVKIQTLKLY